MASHGDGGRNQNESFDITGKAPKFYKIILDNTIHEGKLRIPMSFVRKYGNCISSPIALKVPTGKSWQVELLKIENQIWVQNGFKEFAEYYSLKRGYLLVFQYEGDCSFSVLIFDMSASEIKYPGTRVPSMDPNQELDDSTSNGDQSSEDSHISIEDSDEEFMDVPSSSKTCKAPEAANISSNNPSFKRVIRSKQNMSVPFRFVKRHMECETQTLMLQVANKSWPVSLNVYPPRQTAIISGGWRAFAKENSLEVGDVCNFELITKNLMIVSKF